MNMQTSNAKLIALAAAAAVSFLTGCACHTCCSAKADASPNISVTPFGTTKEGTAVQLYTLQNKAGSVATISSYGGLVTSLKVADRTGAISDVTLGYDNLDGYLKDTPYFGALVGRYGNRIARGHFTLEGQMYTLATNNGVNALHGGLKGFDKVVWTAKPFQSKAGPALELNYVSKDGEEGYPGTLTVKAVYTLTEDNGLKLEYTATTDKPTVANLTHHSYFNLAGKGDVLGHVVMIPADRYTPVDSTLIPTGELAPVEGTAFDFRKPTAIGARIGNDETQLKYGNGYDHNWVINKTMGKLTLMARVSEPTSGRVMEVWSTEPGLQFYSGNFLDGTITGKGNWTYQFRNGFCMEPQHYPDSPNQPNFPSVVLKPGQVYHNIIEYKFSVQP
jgi:aldose 1-epimerase